jgi:hypothetical protein
MGFDDDAKDNANDVDERGEHKAEDIHEDSGDWVDNTRQRLEEGADEAREVHDWMGSQDEDRRIDDDDEDEDVQERYDEEGGS